MAVNLCAGCKNAGHMNNVVQAPGLQVVWCQLCGTVEVNYGGQIQQMIPKLLLKVQQESQPIVI